MKKTIALLLGIFILSIVFVPTTHADSGITYRFQVVWVKIENAQWHLKLFELRTFYRECIYEGLNYWIQEFNAPIGLCFRMNDRYATYSSMNAFLEAWYSGVWTANNGENISIEGRLFLVSGECYYGEHGDEVRSTMFGYERGTVYDGFSGQWDFSASIVTFLQHNYFTQYGDHHSWTHKDDIVNAVAKSLGCTMGLKYCKFASWLRYYRCLVESTTEYGKTCSSLCGLCHNWFYWNIAKKKGWI